MRLLFKRSRTMDAGCGCVVGQLRANNEDNFLFRGAYLGQDNDGLDRILTWRTSLKTPTYLAVFDGMGGEANGEEAAWIAARTLQECTDQLPGERVSLEDVCQKANGRICQRARERGTGLEGTTVAILCLHDMEAEIANLGDSRIFLLRDNELRQLSVDHTDQDLLQAQGITGRKPRLTQHLGIEPEELVIQPYVSRMETRVGDRFLLCTDGLTDMVQEEEIRQILGALLPMGRTVEELITRALDGGGRDNITVICCDVLA